MKDSIPSFGLYGETVAGSNPGLVHIENIRDRSSSRGWVIRPHRHAHLYQVLCVYNGELEVRLDEQHYHLKGTWAVTVPRGSVHSFRFRPESEGVVLSVAEPLLIDEIVQDNTEQLTAIINSPRTIEFIDGDVTLKQLQGYLAAIRVEFDCSNNGRDLALGLLIKLVLLTLHRQHEQGSFQDTDAGANHRRIHKFRTLVDTHFREHWTLSQYARALNTSTSTLNRLCHEVFRTNPKTIIQNRLMNEIKRRLIYTQQPLDQMAYNLGFNDPAYFSRYFKKLEGVTPSIFRERNTYTLL